MQVVVSPLAMCTACRVAHSGLTAHVAAGLVEIRRASPAQTSRALVIAGHHEKKGATLPKCIHVAWFLANLAASYISTTPVSDCKGLANLLSLDELLRLWEPQKWADVRSMRTYMVVR